ncbi:MAG: hypothetical protein M3550_03625 [Actinomycetota bacterium]|nr:hypothetical protein [Actinomycetota bacterium]
MAKTKQRPADDLYWRRPWSQGLFAGDLFEAIPFSSQPTLLVEAEGEQGQHKHYVGEIAFAYGLLITPTCDMTDQATGGVAHPFRVLVPVVAFDEACDALGTPEDKRGLIRSRDSSHPYLYLPSCPGLDEGELIALLYRPALVAEEFLRSPPRRIAQLHPQARRYLKVKLAAYWARAAVDPEALPAYERDEPEPTEGPWPPSPYDDPAGDLAADLPPAEWDPAETTSA